MFSFGETLFDEIVFNPPSVEVIEPSTCYRRSRGFFTYRYPEESDLIVVEPKLIFSVPDVLLRIIENPVIIEEGIPVIDVYALAREEDELILLGIY